MALAEIMDSAGKKYKACNLGSKYDATPDGLARTNACLGFRGLANGVHLMVTCKVM